MFLNNAYDRDYNRVVTCFVYNKKINCLKTLDSVEKAGGIILLVDIFAPDFADVPGKPWGEVGV